MKSNIDAIISKEKNKGERYQVEFAKFVSGVKHDIAVETGEGVSSLWLLKLCPKIKLYSVDLNPWSGFEIVHPNHKAIRQKTTEALPVLFQKTGKWDVFLHDSDHGFANMTWELEFAYGAVRSGGYIACDDYTWENHGAWDQFVKLHKLDWFTIGSLAVTKVP